MSHFAVSLTTDTIGKTRRRILPSRTLAVRTRTPEQERQGDLERHTTSFHSGTWFRKKGDWKAVEWNLFNKVINCLAYDADSGNNTPGNCCALPHPDNPFNRTCEIRSEAYRKLGAAKQQRKNRNVWSVLLFSESVFMGSQNPLHHFHNKRILLVLFSFIPQSAAEFVPLRVTCLLKTAFFESPIDEAQHSR